MQPLLVADIGGTNARFALALVESQGTLQLAENREYSCAEYASFGDVLNQYISSLKEKNIKHASIAIAGPIFGENAKMTNLDWHFSVEKIRAQFGFDTVVFVNDLAAHALAAVYLDPCEFERIKPGNRQEQSTRTVIGLGTGLGVAALQWYRDQWRAFPTEGGHISFSPLSELEQEIHRILCQQHGYVSLEMVSSGLGLLNIYQTLAVINNQSADLVNSREILNNVDGNKLCAQSVTVMVAVLANAAGDLALAHGATGGIYLTGGMTNYVLPFIRHQDFTRRFLQQGFRKEYLTSIPIDVVLYSTSGLLGAGLWYHQHRPVHEPAV